MMLGLKLQRSRIAMLAFSVSRVGPQRRAFPPLRASLSALAQRKEVFATSIDPAPLAETVQHPDAEVGDQPIPFKAIEHLISPGTYKAITHTPFTHTDMTPVQSAVLDLLPTLTPPYSPKTDPAHPPMRDLLVKAKTGTGKTLAFLVPAIEHRLKVLEQAGAKALSESGSNDARLKSRAMETYARTNVGTLIISPTRELASQIAAEALKLTSHHGQFNVCLFVGGESKGAQMRDFGRRKDIVVATPGRLKDIIQNTREMRPALRNVSTLVLDEADTLLDMGFRADIESIIDELPTTPARQTFLFSATVSPAIRDIARKSLDKHHAFINTVSSDDSPVHAHIPQHCTILPSSADQLSHVANLIAHDQLQNPGKSKVIVFFNTTKATQMFAQLLNSIKTQLPQPYTQILELHSKKDQKARTRISNLFRQDRSGSTVLATSDVSARGVDYPGVTRVIQVGIPSTAEQYVHRVGRTGRGKSVEGRGDLVLLPFEQRFPKTQLEAVGLKACTVEELQNEVKSLATQHDNNPQAFFNAVDVDHSDRRGPRPFPPSVSQRLENLPVASGHAIKEVSPETAEDVYLSVLGYYAGQKDVLRCGPSEIMNGCNEWMTEGMKSKPPQISSMFLAKLGLGSSKSAPRSRPGHGRPTSQWSSRGSDRAPSRGFERSPSRGFERGASRGFERAPNRGFERSDRGSERSDRGFERGGRRAGSWSEGTARRREF